MALIFKVLLSFAVFGDFGVVLLFIANVVKTESNNSNLFEDFAEVHPTLAIYRKCNYLSFKLRMLRLKVF